MFFDEYISEDLGVIGYFITVIICVILPLIYHLGDYILGLQTVDSSGKPIGIVLWIAHFALGTLFCWLTWIGIFTEDGRCLHDQLFNVYVVHKSKE